MAPILLVLVVEDDLSEAIVRKILRFAAQDFQVTLCLGRKGQGYIKSKIASFNKSAPGLPFLILTDLDQESCAPLLISRWLPSPKSSNLLFRVAVHEVEAWLLAHASALAKFLGVPRERIPTVPEEVSHPKREIIALARKSRIKNIKDDIVPLGSSKQGRNYNGRLIAFVEHSWDVSEALKNADSLRRFCDALSKFQAEHD